MSRQDSFDLDTEYPFILSDCDFEPYIELRDGYIKFQRVKDQPSKIAVVASFYDTMTGRYEPLCCVISYIQYLNFYNSTKPDSNIDAIKTKLRDMSGTEQ